MAGVNKNVSFRMPIRFLGRACESLDFGEMIDPFRIKKKLEAERRFFTLGGPFKPLLPNPLRRQFPETLFHAPREHKCLRCSLQLEPGGELHPAQDSERILDKSLTRMAQHTVF